MKKIMTIALFMILLLPIAVNAGSINGAQYYDRDTFWGGSTTRTLNDNNVNIDADTLNGRDVGDLRNMMDNKDANVLNDAKTFAHNQDVKTLNKAKTFAQNEDVKTLSDAKTFAKTQDKKTLKKSKKYTRKQDKKTLASANTYSDAGDVVAVALANAYADANDAKGSSFNGADMRKYIYGEEYLAVLDARYVQQFDFAEIVFRNKAYMETLRYAINHPNVEFHFDEVVNIKTARFMAEYTGVEQVIGKTTCRVNGHCVTV